MPPENYKKRFRLLAHPPNDRRTLPEELEFVSQEDKTEFLEIYKKYSKTTLKPMKITGDPIYLYLDY